MSLAEQSQVITQKPAGNYKSAALKTKPEPSNGSRIPADRFPKVRGRWKAISLSSLTKRVN